MTDAVALIGSPLQLIGLIEALHLGAVGPEPRVFLQAQGDVVDAMPGAGRELLGEIVEVDSPRRRIEASRALRSADEAVVGDAYSQLFHVVLAGGLRGRVVLLEDGAASLRMLDVLSGAGERLVRAHDSRVVARSLGSVAARRLGSLARVGRVSTVGAFDLPDATERALEARRVGRTSHRFALVRANTPGHPGSDLRRWVLGSALVADGYVRTEDYLRWLRERLDDGAVFWPHRRETGEAMRLATSLGSEVPEQTNAPIELRIGQLAPGGIVETLPSTAALTLPIVAPHVIVRCSPVAPSWWNSDVRGPLVELMERITKLAGDD